MDHMETIQQMLTGQMDMKTFRTGGRFSVLSKLVRKSFDYLSKPMLIFVKKLKTENRPLSMQYY